MDSYLYYLFTFHLVLSIYSNLHFKSLLDAEARAAAEAERARKEAEEAAAAAEAEKQENPAE